MTGTSSEYSEEAAGADILDLDRYMRGTRPAREPPRVKSSSGLVVDGGAAGRILSSSASSASEPSEPSDKRFSHDSGLSDTSYRRGAHYSSHAKAEESSKSSTEKPRRHSRRQSESPRGEVPAARRGSKGGETRRRGSKSGEATKRSSESSRSLRETLERALRDQQAQIARVAQLCEQQARTGASERRVSERPSERHKRSDASERPSDHAKAEESSKSSTEKPRRHSRRQSESPRGEVPAARRGSKGGETRRRGSKSGEATKRSSESSRSLRETLERALRDQQAQIARVAQLCEQQARTGASERRVSERPSERHKRSDASERPSDDKQTERRKKRRELSERSSKRSERSSKLSELSSRPSKRKPRHSLTKIPTPSFTGTSDFSSSSSSVPLKRRTSECRTYKIIMSKLDELNRMFVARRSAGAPGAAPPPPAPPARPAPRRLAPASSGSVTVSDKVVGTESSSRTGRQAKRPDSARAVVVATAAVDIPPAARQNVVTESVVRDEEETSGPASEKGMPGRFHLDDPVRLYQQAKRLERGERRSPRSADKERSPASSAHSSGDSGRGSGSSRSRRGEARGSPSLCALCRCYWLVARRYLAAQIGAVKE